MAGCKGSAATRDPGRVKAPGVAEPCDHPRLVVRRPESDAIAETADDVLGVLRERLRGLPYRPAAVILHCLWQVPVVQRGVGLDAAGEQLVDEAVVVVEPGLVHAAASLGQDPRPRDREAEGVDPELVASARRRRGSGGRSRRRQTRLGRSRRCREQSRSDPRSIRPVRPRTPPPRSGTRRWRRPRRSRLGKARVIMTRRSPRRGRARRQEPAGLHPPPGRRRRPRARARRPGPCARL